MQSLLLELGYGVMISHCADSLMMCRSANTEVHAIAVLVCVMIDCLLLCMIKIKVN